MPMQYTEIFNVVKKMKNFSKKNDIFLIFAQNIDCGYTLEPPRPLEPPLQIPVFLFKSGIQGGILFMDMFY